MAATVVLENIDVLPSSRDAIRERRERTRFVFSVIVAIVGECPEAIDPTDQSKDILDPVSPSHTCISWYGCTRELSTCCHAPISWRKDTDEGVKLLQRLEYWLGSGSHFLDLARSWLSMRATFSFEVTGDASD